MKLRNQLERLLTNATYLHAHTPKALTAIRERLDDADGYPTHVPGASPPTASPHPERKDEPVSLTSVESAAEQRRPAANAERMIIRLIDDAVAITNRLVTIIDKWHPNPPRASSARCTGGYGLPGALEWGKPDCADMGTSRRGGLCDSCYQRRRRWNRRNNR